MCWRLNHENANSATARLYEICITVELSTLHWEYSEKSILCEHYTCCHDSIRISDLAVRLTNFFVKKFCHQVLILNKLHQDPAKGRGILITEASAHWDSGSWCRGGGGKIYRCQLLSKLYCLCNITAGTCGSGILNHKIHQIWFKCLLVIQTQISTSAVKNAKTCLKTTNICQQW